MDADGVTLVYVMGKQVVEKYKVGNYARSAPVRHLRRIPDATRENNLSRFSHLGFGDPLPSAP